MKNEKDLMRLYNEMHDERCRQIELMSKRQAFLIAEDLLLVVAVIASFINSYLVRWYHYCNNCIYLCFYYL